MDGWTALTGTLFVGFLDPSMNVIYAGCNHWVRLHVSCWVNQSRQLWSLLFLPRLLSTQFLPGFFWGWLMSTHYDLTLQCGIDCSAPYWKLAIGAFDNKHVSKLSVKITFFWIVNIWNTHKPLNSQPQVHLSLLIVKQKAPSKAYGKCQKGTFLHIGCIFWSQSTESIY